MSEVKATLIANAIEGLIRDIILSQRFDAPPDPNMKKWLIEILKLKG